MFKKLYIATLALALFGLFGCVGLEITGGPSTQDLVTAYSKAGNIMYQVFITVKADCDNKVLNESTCTSFKLSYNDARTAYKTAGDALQAYISAETPEARANAQLKYNDAIVQTMRFIDTTRQQLKK